MKKIASLILSVLIMCLPIFGCDKPSKGIILFRDCFEKQMMSSKYELDENGEFVVKTREIIEDSGNLSGEYIDDSFAGINLYFTDKLIGAEIQSLSYWVYSLTDDFEVNIATSFVMPSVNKPTVVTENRKRSFKKDEPLEIKMGIYKVLTAKSVDDLAHISVVIPKEDSLAFYNTYGVQRWAFGKVSLKVIVDGVYYDVGWNYVKTTY